LILKEKCRNVKWLIGGGTKHGLNDEGVVGGGWSRLPQANLHRTTVKRGFQIREGRGLRRREQPLWKIDAKAKSNEIWVTGSPFKMASLFSKRSRGLLLFGRRRRKGRRETPGRRDKASEYPVNERRTSLKTFILRKKEGKSDRAKRTKGEKRQGPK